MNDTLKPIITDDLIKEFDKFKDIMNSIKLFL